MAAAYIALPVLSNAAVSITQKPCSARVGKEYAPFFNAATIGVVLLCFDLRAVCRESVKNFSLAF